MIGYNSIGFVPMSNLKRRIVVFGTAGLVALSAFVIADETLPTAQEPTEIPKPKIGSDTLTFESSVGSFKLLGSDETPATGTLSFNFNGTVLVTGDEAKVTTEGNVRQEYEKKEFAKKLYFGQGKMTVTGKVRSIQFFGSDVKGSFKGIGIMRMYGEFDKNLETGYFQFAGGERTPWGTNGLQVAVPQQIWEQSATDVKIRDN